MTNVWAEPATREPEVPAEIEAVVLWRYEELVRAGFSTEDATEVACHFEIDLHYAADLVLRGCPSGTAREILL
jgi:hypothetical protein